MNELESVIIMFDIDKKIDIDYDKFGMDFQPTVSEVLDNSRINLLILDIIIV